MIQSAHAPDLHPVTSTMAGYDSTLTMSSSAPNMMQNDILRLTTSDPRLMVAPGMEAFEHEMHFESKHMLDESGAMSAIPFTPGYELSDPFATTFDDPFSYQSGPFKSFLDENPPAANPENAGDLDNKLLGFGALIHKAPLFDDSSQTLPQMTAELYGMFFVAEDVFGGETNGRPMELTCYRRNLFQISGAITLSRTVKVIMNDQGQHVPIYDMFASLSAIESIEGKSTEIISVPWKTNAASSSEERAGAAPPRVPLDLMVNPELDPRSVSIPIAWKRLQFKHATANNGRRKGLQQHYVIQINLMATLTSGEVVKIAEIQSGAIIVRGRSPRNFDSRKDVVLSERKSDAKQRTMSDSAKSTGDASANVKVDPAVSSGAYKFYSSNALQSPNLPEWKANNASQAGSEISPPRAKKASISSGTQRPAIPKTKWKSDISPSKTGQGSAPIDLSLADDETARSASNLSHSGRVGDVSPVIGKKNIGSPIENADLLYEYFPLTVDDWMPPVDAIYRPHVVHHTTVPADLKALQVKSKTKRYFSAED